MLEDPLDADGVSTVLHLRGCDVVSIAASFSLHLPSDSLPGNGMMVGHRRHSLVEALRHSLDMDAVPSVGIFDIRQFLAQHPDIDCSPAPCRMEPTRREDPKGKRIVSWNDEDEEWPSGAPCASWRSSLNSTGSSYVTRSSTSSSSCTMAEAISDHVAVLSDELPFACGDTITVLDSSSPSGLWYGVCRDSQGWFPSSYVRVVSGVTSPPLSIDDRESFPIAMRTQRSKAVDELIHTERDYVQLLENIVHGFLEQTKHRHGLFSPESVARIFGNIDELYSLHCRLLRDLEVAYNPSQPETTLVGAAFLRHRRSFAIYADYCNNRPVSCAELAQLARQPIFQQFFEACRLLRGMPRLTLEGFLLSPVQRICRYPLQLSQLLKATPSSHGDFSALSSAMLAMREVVIQLDDRRRRIECLQNLCLWQNSVQGWRGPDLLENNSLLLKSGEAFCRCSVNGSQWAKQVTVFLFDSTLVLCKKDVFSRNTFIFKERISLSSVQPHDIPDGKDSSFNVSVKNAFRLSGDTRQFLFTVGDREQKASWLRAFADARKIVPSSPEEKRMAFAALKALKVD